MRKGLTIRPKTAALLSLIAAGVVLTGCQSESPTQALERIKSDPKESFSSKDFGVKASPRVTDLKNVRKGGGRDQVGKPYKVAGRWYYPKEQPGYVKVGHASWYGASFHGRLTANGEVYDMFGLSAAHPTFPLPSYARVTNQANGASVVVRVNDRGPYVADRVMDLSSKAAELLGYKQDGVGNIKVEYVGRAPLEGDDTPVLMASYHAGKTAPSIDDGLPSGVQVASVEAPTRLAFATALMAPGAKSLPGVRSAIGAAASGGAATSIEAIIGDTGAAPTALPRPRPSRASELVVASYAPAPARRAGAADALAALARPLGAASERIEIGLVADRNVLAALRGVAAGHGRLVADASPEGTSYVLELGQGQDADAMLGRIWDAGCTDAFVLRD